MHVCHARVSKNYVKYHYQLRCSTKPLQFELRYRAVRALLLDRVMPFSFDDDSDDHSWEECGVFGDPDMSSLCYLLPAEAATPRGGGLVGTFSLTGAPRQAPRK